MIDNLINRMKSVFFNHFNHLNFKTVIKKGTFDLNVNHLKVRYVVNNSITE